MPFSLSLHLIAPSPAAAPPTGQQLRGFVYSLLARAHPRLAEEIHALPDHKPFTVSPLRRGAAEGAPATTRRRLRVTTLTTEAGAALLQGIEALCRDGGLAVLGETTYALDLAAGLVRSSQEVDYSTLGAAPALSTVELLATSPTAFKAGPRNVPLPLPEPLLKSLVVKWNAFSDTGAVDEAAASALLGSVVLARHEIRTARLCLADRSEVGFVGRIRLQLHDRDPDLQRLFATLMRFSEFAGIGARCTLGMGQVKFLGGR